jgi:hypothetical protein
MSPFFSQVQTLGGEVFCWHALLSAFTSSLRAQPLGLVDTEATMCMATEEENALHRYDKASTPAGRQ